MIDVTTCATAYGGYVLTVVVSAVVTFGLKVLKNGLDRLADKLNKLHESHEQLVKTPSIKAIIDSDSSFNGSATTSPPSPDSGKSS